MSNDDRTVIVQRLRESASLGLVVIVEGETDVAFLGGMLGEDAPFLMAVDGRSNALALAEVIPTEALLDSAVLVLVDADFDRITGKIRDYDGQMHVVFTDAHDLEMMIISIEVLRRRVLTTVLRCSLVEALTIWNRALAYQIEVSLLRLVVHCESFGVSVEGIPPNSVHDDDGTISRGRLVTEALPRFRSAGVDLGPGEIMSLLSAYEEWQADWPQLVNGHALCRSIAVYARMTIGRSVSGEQVEDGLRLASQRSDFDATELAGPSLPA